MKRYFLYTALDEVEVSKEEWESAKADILTMEGFVKFYEYGDWWDMETRCRVTVAEFMCAEDVIPRDVEFGHTIGED